MTTEIAEVVARLRSEATAQNDILAAKEISSGTKADLIALCVFMGSVADLLEREHAARVEAERKLRATQSALDMALDHEGVAFHRAEAAECERDELRKRIEVAPKMIPTMDGLGSVVPQYIGKRVAIVALGEGE